MRKINKFLIGFLLMSVLMILPTRVNAGLQANKGGTKLYSTKASKFFTGIRTMETSNGTLGKASNINASTLLDSSANGIDCHMVKNTEWGTMAMLCASAYGEPPYQWTQAGSTTTGNASGVCDIATNFGGDYVAATRPQIDTLGRVRGTASSADGRYYNSYSSSTSIPGDATTETAGWYGTTTKDFISFSNASYSVFVRIAGLFGYKGADGDENEEYSSRAVVVCGEGL